MATIKVFYKRETPTKRFFSKEVEVRSFAYGEAVSKEFSDWREYFLKSVSTYRDKFRPLKQKHFYGEPFEMQAQSPSEQIRYVNGEKYELLADGVIAVGGTRSDLQVGTETKAWALISFPRREGQVRAVAVIGKPKGSSEMELCVYRTTAGRLETEPCCRAPLETTLDAESYLVAFGRHLLLVHNFTLDYYYFDYENAELQRVAIGKDGNNEESEFCKFVAPRVVAADSGYVFWHTESCVYGFPIGYPKHLVEFSCPSTEKVTHIQCDGGCLVVYRQDKNTSQIFSYRYERTERGEFRQAAFPESVKIR